MAGVRNGENDVSAGYGFRLPWRHPILELNVSRFDFEHAAIGHRIPSVHTQVEQHLVQSRGIAQDGEEVVCDFRLDLDRTWKCIPHELVYL